MPVRHFSESYAEARTRFIEAATRAGAPLQHFENPAGPGPTGETLATDVALFGPEDATKLLVLLSGTHGVEGFAGSGAQVSMIESLRFGALPARTAVLVVHAINPYGFAWLRRTNEDNVDLNRNALDFDDLPEPSPDFVALEPHLVPRDWTDLVPAEVAIKSFIAEHGFRRFQEVVTGGQYTAPDGLFYGGSAPVWSTRTFREIVTRYGHGKQRLALIDIHTGLGPCGYGEPIYTGHDDDEAARVRDWYGPDVTAIHAGNSASVVVQGPLLNAVRSFFDDHDDEARDHDARARVRHGARGDRARRAARRGLDARARRDQLRHRGRPRAEAALPRRVLRRHRLLEAVGRRAHGRDDRQRARGAGRLKPPHVPQAVEPTAAPAPAWRAWFNRRMLICVFLGFTSGLPLYIQLYLLQAWLKTEGVSLRDIGLFALIQFPYTWKFVWAPLVDRYRVPGLARLGRRRGWMLATQVVVAALVASIGLLQPKADLATIAVLCGVLAFFAASLDIVVDAFRREILPDAELALGTAVHVNAYKLAGLIPGSLSLILADHLPWDVVFAVTAAFMLPGIAMVFFVAEPTVRGAPPRSLRDAVVLPFVEFVARDGWRAGARRARVHLPVQDRRFDGDRAVDRVLSRPRLHEDADRPDREERRPVGERRRRPDRRRVARAPRHQSRPVDLRRAAARVDLRLRVARVGGTRPSSCSRSRSASRRSRASGSGRPRSRRSSRATPTALHGDAVRAVHEPRRRAADVRERRRRLPRRGRRLVRLLRRLRRARHSGPAAVAEGRAVAAR